jgi:hypothetical protein
MGEAKQKKSATQKFIAKHSHCCFCGGIRAAVTREHMPPKSLFDNSHRPDKLVMPACDECNRGTSTADLVASIVSRWNYNTLDQSNTDHAKLAARIRNKHPELLEEWNKLTPKDRIGALLHLREHGIQVPEDAGLVSIGPLTIRQLNLFSHKAALALYFEQFRTHLTDEGRVCAFWRTKEDFAKEGIPPDLLEMMRQYGTLEQGKWNASETFEYRFDSNKIEGLFACLARLRGNLFVTGLVASDATVLKGDATDWAADWIAPSSLLGMMDDPRFEEKS